MREVLATVKAVVSDRIFTEGKASDGSLIGQYSEGYLKTRSKKRIIWVKGYSTIYSADEK